MTAVIERDIELLEPQPDKAPGFLARIPRPSFFSWIGIPALVFMALVFIVPLVVILTKSFTDPGPQNFSDAVNSGIFRRSLWTTIKMAFFVTIVCLLVSYPYAYAMARGGKLIVAVLLGALMLSFWTSTLVRTYAWQILLNNTGVINKTLINLGLIDEPIQMIRTNFSVYLGMAHVLAPFTILTLYAQMRTIKPELEQAAQVMGARPSVAFLRITLPLSLPGAAAGGILVFVMALGFYITPQILGSSRDTYIGTAIIQQVQVFLKTGVGAAESLILLGIVLLVLLVAGKFIGIGRILGLNKGE
ncbi:MAG: transporter permease [Pseudonocardiales bacterium]|nr:transporter permease [Jatrophihabitantaceae bacterium]MCW2603838.1 transporter permease [Pseudonocardiales bacterium]